MPMRTRRISRSSVAPMGTREGTAAACRLRSGCGAWSIAPEDFLKRWVSSGQRQVQVLDRLVDLGRRLVADADAVDAGVPEGEPHRLLPVLAVEGAFAHELHRDHA